MVTAGSTCHAVEAAALEGGIPGLDKGMCGKMDRDSVRDVLTGRGEPGARRALWHRSHAPSGGERQYPAQPSTT